MRHFSGDEVSKILRTINDPQYNAMRLHLKVANPDVDAHSFRPQMEETKGEGDGHAELGSNPKRDP